MSADYPSQETAIAEIARSIRTAVEPLQSAAFSDADLQQAIAVAQAIYRVNVFPEMNVGWGTYTSQMGHVTATGCFRCHDDNHRTPAGVAISQDCELCHAFE